MYLHIITVIDGPLGARSGYLHEAPCAYCGPQTGCAAPPITTEALQAVRYSALALKTVRGAWPDYKFSALRVRAVHAAPGELAAPPWLGRGPQSAATRSVLRMENTLPFYPVDDERGDLTTTLADMVADVLHYARANMCDPDAILRRARTHFDAEKP